MCVKTKALQYRESIEYGFDCIEFLIEEILESFEKQFPDDKKLRSDKHNILIELRQLRTDLFEA